MPDFLKIMTLAAFVAFGSTAIAQTTTSQEQPAKEATEEAAPETTPDTNDNVLGLDGGQEVADPNAPGTPYIRETHGDWELRCVRAPEGETEPCKLYQLLTDGEGNGVAEINIFKLPEDQKFAAGALVITPLETMLTEQLTITVDGGPQKRYRFTWCAADGCYARIGLSGADIASFKRGAGASITIVPMVAPDQQVTLNLSLTGFTKGYAAMVAAAE